MAPLRQGIRVQIRELQSAITGTRAKGDGSGDTLSAFREVGRGLDRAFDTRAVEAQRAAPLSDSLSYGMGSRSERLRNQFSREGGS